MSDRPSSYSPIPRRSKNVHPSDARGILSISSQSALLLGLRVFPRICPTDQRRGGKYLVVPRNRDRACLGAPESPSSDGTTEEGQVSDNKAIVLPHPFSSLRHEDGRLDGYVIHSRIYLCHVDRQPFLVAADVGYAAVVSYCGDSVC